MKFSMFDSCLEEILQNLTKELQGCECDSRTGISQITYYQQTRATNKLKEDRTILFHQHYVCGQATTVPSEAFSARRTSSHCFSMKMYKEPRQR